MAAGSERGGLPVILGENKSRLIEVRVLPWLVIYLGPFFDETNKPINLFMVSVWEVIMSVNILSNDIVQSIKILANMGEYKYQSGGYN